MNPSIPAGVVSCLALLPLASGFAAAEPEPVPESSRRPVVVSLPAGSAKAPVPKAELPEGYVLEVAAAAPLVTHPIMGCLDDRGRLFIGDAVGVNWNKAQLDANPPNRVLLLEDTDRDGKFDKSTVFADKMTFPQGAQWLNGSLYVGSPPGIWKLTDSDGDGVADERVMIVSGFDYTGNAADVHGPFLHPNGRLYWCHGRKGYRVTDASGKVVHEGASSGIWSARPDGSDVQWHSLLAGDNPVEVDFTPQGELIGVQNIYYSQPRGDTIVHWLYGGVYERPDMMKVLEGLPRTLDTMPVMYNFGHVAVSGACFWKRYPGPALQFLVPHFNTQRLVRMELTPEGATYRAQENEFLKINDPDVHFTDVLEDGDGSLLVLNTGGWFRIGCPSSLLAKPELLGSIYRVRPPNAIDSPGSVWQAQWKAPGTSSEEWLAGLADPDPQVRLRTLAALAQSGERNDAVRVRLAALMDESLDAPLEHALLFAAKKWQVISTAEQVRAARTPRAQRRMLSAFIPASDAERKGGLALALGQLASADADLAGAALKMVAEDPGFAPEVVPVLRGWLAESTVSSARLAALAGYCGIRGKEAVDLVTAMLDHSSAEVRRTALECLAGQNTLVFDPRWIPALEKGLNEGSGPSALLLDALKKLKTPLLDARLQEIANDPQRPSALRLKALDAIQSRKITPEVFTLLVSTLTADPSAAARIQAATMLGSGGLSPEQLTELAPAFAALGPIELKELLRLVRTVKEPGIARSLSIEVAKNPSLASQQESVYRTLFSAQPPELFETIILPALREAEAVSDAKKRRLGPLAEKAAAEGNPVVGRAHLEAGKGTCIACHKIGELGRAIGPDLSTIGAIRTERDLVESILFPSNTLSRDYEAHVIETTGGETLAGVIRSHTAEGLLLVDAAGQERNVPHDRILSNTVLPVSLMPMGLDASLSERELLDVVACLRSLR